MRAERVAHRRQRHARDGAGRPVGALHRSRVAARRAGRHERAATRHARAGQEPQLSRARARFGPTGATPSGGRRPRTPRSRPPKLAPGMPRRSCTRWTRRASTSRCCSRAAGSSCSGSTAPSRRAPTATSRSSRRRSRGRTTTGCTTSARRTRPGCSAPALLAPHDVDAAVDEIERTVNDFGFKTVFLYPGCVNRRPWHDPHYDPIWRGVRAPRRADLLPRRRSELPPPRLHARGVRQRS